MNAPVWTICVGYSLFILLLAFATGKFFNRKAKEVKDGPVCPVRGIRLTRHETVFNHCFSCPYRDIRKCKTIPSHVKS